MATRSEHDARGRTLLCAHADAIRRHGGQSSAEPRPSQLGDWPVGAKARRRELGHPLLIAVRAAAIPSEMHSPTCWISAAHLSQQGCTGPTCSDFIELPHRPSPVPTR